MTQVINVHHYGGVEKLPPGSVYIGRPSSYGNPYSTESGKFCREECVAFHRIDLYESFIKDPTYFKKLEKELKDKSLACWCKNPKKEIACHGDNFRHVFKDINKDRDYSKSVIFYLLDDVRKSFEILLKWVMTKPTFEEFTFCYFDVYEARAEIEFLFTVIKTKKPHIEVICEYIARVAIELELAIESQSIPLRSYWLRHCGWTINRILHPDVPYTEPVLEAPKIKRKKKGLKNV